MIAHVDLFDVARICNDGHQTDNMITRKRRFCVDAVDVPSCAKRGRIRHPEHYHDDRLSEIVISIVASLHTGVERMDEQ